MIDVISSIDSAVARLNEVRAIVEKEPAFAHFICSGIFCADPLQMHADGRLSVKERQQSAKAVAMALAPNAPWFTNERGGWHTKDLTIFLHNIEDASIKKAVDFSTIS